MAGCLLPDTDPTISAPRCPNCGYCLAELALPRNCPECGHFADPSADRAAAIEWVASWRGFFAWKPPPGVLAHLEDPRARRVAKRRILIFLLLGWTAASTALLVADQFKIVLVTERWWVSDDDPERKLDYRTTTKRIQPFEFDINIRYLPIDDLRYLVFHNARPVQNQKLSIRFIPAWPDYWFVYLWFSPPLIVLLALLAGGGILRLIFRCRVTPFLAWASSWYALAIALLVLSTWTYLLMMCVGVSKYDYISPIAYGLAIVALIAGPVFAAVQFIRGRYPHLLRPSLLLLLPTTIVAGALLFAGAWFFCALAIILYLK